jgi:hypothetical protein
MPEVIRVSHSAIRQNISCPRKRFFEGNLRLFPETGSIAMRYGSGFHKGMEEYYKSGKDVTKAMEAVVAFWQKPTVQIFNEDYRNLESLLTSIGVYDTQFRDDPEVVVGVPEGKNVTRILLTDEEKEHFGDIEVDFVVVLDLILGIDGMNWVVDFKTTSVALAYMASRLRRMPQLMGYQFDAQQNYENIVGTMVYYHQLKATKSRKTGEYGANTTDFMKFPQIYSQKDYKDWRKYVIWNAFKLKKAAEADYPPNYNSCYEFNAHCPYLGLCDYPKWSPERFLEMDGYVVVPDEREENNGEGST